MFNIPLEATTLLKDERNLLAYFFSMLEFTSFWFSTVMQNYVVAQALMFHKPNYIHMQIGWK